MPLSQAQTKVRKISGVIRRNGRCRTVEELDSAYGRTDSFVVIEARYSARPGATYVSQ